MIRVLLAVAAFLVFGYILALLLLLMDPARPFS